MNQTDRLRAILTAHAGTVVSTADLRLALGGIRLEALHNAAHRLRRTGVNVVAVCSIGYMVGADLPPDRTRIKAAELLGEQERIAYEKARGVSYDYIGNAAALRAIGRADLLGERA